LAAINALDLSNANSDLMLAVETAKELTEEA
jgi:hypothetical protein